MHVRKHSAETIAIFGTMLLLYVFLSIHCGAALGQTRARTGVWTTPTPDPLTLQSANFVQLDAGVLNVNSIRAVSIDAGSVRSDLVTAGVVDAGTTYTHALRNVDGGSVYSPGGVTVDTGKYITLTGPGGSGRISHTGTNLLLDGSPGAIVATDGLTAQGNVTAGSLQTVAGRVSGATSSATVSAVPGSGSPTDADLNLNALGTGYVRVLGESGLTAVQAGNADGGVLTVTGQAVYVNAIWLKPTARESIPECTPDLRGMKVLAEGTLDGEGDVLEEQVCDGTSWIVRESLTTLRVPPKAGDVPFYALFPNRPSSIRYVATVIQDQGSGAAPYEIIMRSGSTVLCRGGGLCTDPIGVPSGITCTTKDFPRNPDGGAAFTLVGEIDAGCAANPGIVLTVKLRAYGYPKDGGWNP